MVYSRGGFPLSTVGMATIEELKEIEKIAVSSYNEKREIAEKQGKIVKLGSGSKLEKALLGDFDKIGSVGNYDKPVRFGKDLYAKYTAGSIYADRYIKSTGKALKEDYQTIECTKKESNLNGSLELIKSDYNHEILILPGNNQSGYGMLEKLNKRSAKQLYRWTNKGTYSERVFNRLYHGGKLLKEHWYAAGATGSIGLMAASGIDEVLHGSTPFSQAARLGGILGVCALSMVGLHLMNNEMIKRGA